MLNVRFGFQTEEATQSTAIGWGLIAEAFANFGLAGVFGMGIVAGTIAGCFTRCSCGASPVSPGAIVGIVGLVTMMNLEGDFAGLLASLWQSLISVAVLSSVVRLFQAAPSLVDAASVPDRVKTLATALTARGESETPIADARGSAGSISYGAAIVRERHLPRAATGARP